MAGDPSEAEAAIRRFESAIIACHTARIAVDSARDALSAAFHNLRLAEDEASAARHAMWKNAMWKIMKSRGDAGGRATSTKRDGGRPFRAQSIKAHNEFRIGDNVRWTPDPLAVPFTSALEGPIDQCPRMCGTVVNLDNLGQPFQVRVTALEGDWSVSPIGWRPEPGDVVVAHSVDRAGIIERVTEEVIDLDGVGDDIPSGDGFTMEDGPIDVGIFSR